MMPSVQKTWAPPYRYKTRDFTVFKSYCIDIRNHLDLAMVRTADTGQVNLEAMTAPDWTVASTSMGYLIYRFDDVLQATKPVFLRIEFFSFIWSQGNNGTGYQGQGCFHTRITVGTGTDGAGTITNPSTIFYYPFSTYQGTSAEAASRPADRMGVNFLTYNPEQGFLFFVYGANAWYRAGTNNYGFYVNLAQISIQRTLDDYGQQDGRGIVVVGRSEINEGAASDYVPPKIQTYIYATNTWTTAERTNILTQETAEINSYYWQMPDGKFLIYPLKYWDPDYGIKSHPNIMYIPTTIDSPGVVYTVESIPNRPRKFRSLGAFAMWKPTARGFGDYSCLTLWE